MATQRDVALDEIRTEMSGGVPEKGSRSDQAERGQQVTSATCEGQDRLRANASRRLLLALDDFDSLLADAPYLPDPDHEGWRAALYPWIEDLARARQHVTEALSSLGVQPIGARGEPFDPDCHEVAATEGSGADLATQHIIRVMRPGFRLGACVLRQARVVVTALPTDPADRAHLLSATQRT